MRKAVLAFGLVLGVCACWPAESVACGDKFLVVGRGTSRVMKARHPASILIYARPGADLPRVAREMRLEATLRRAGHAVDTVTDDSAMAAILAAQRHDFVIADASDAGAVERMASGGRAEVVPVASREAPPEALRALKARHALVIPAGKSLGYLTALDRMMGRRPSAASSR